MSYFSIIMPVKNRQKLIGAAIRSIIDQTCNDWELIVVDDHSTDETPKVVKNFQDIRIKYLKMVEGTGPGAARDFGIKNTSGEFIVIADSDDFNLPNRLEKTRDFLLKYPDTDIVYARSITINDSVETIRPTELFNADLLKKYNFISNPTTVFRKSAYRSTNGYDLNLKTSEDYDLWLTFLENNFVFRLLDEPLVKQIIHQEGTTKQIELAERKKNLAYVRHKHHLEIPTFDEFERLAKNPQLIELVSTGRDFWFK